MSAFIVSEQCMHNAVMAMLGFKHSGVDPTTLGKELYQLNQEAVRQRYGEEEEVPDYQFSPPAEDTSKHQLLKSLCCLIYQCTEGNVPDTKLYKAMEQCSLELAMEIVINSLEYEMARWD